MAFFRDQMDLTRLFFMPLTLSSTDMSACYTSPHIAGCWRKSESQWTNCSHRDGTMQSIQTGKLKNEHNNGSFTLDSSQLCWPFLTSWSPFTETERKCLFNFVKRVATKILVLLESSPTALNMWRFQSVLVTSAGEVSLISWKGKQYTEAGCNAYRQLKSFFDDVTVETPHRWVSTFSHVRNCVELPNVRETDCVDKPPVIKQGYCFHCRHRGLVHT